MRNEKRNLKEAERVVIEGKVKARELQADAAAHPPAYTRDDIHEKLALGQWNVEEPERWDGMS